MDDDEDAVTTPSLFDALLRPRSSQELRPPPLSPVGAETESMVDIARRSLAEIRADIECTHEMSERVKLRAAEHRAMTALARATREEEMSEDRYVRMHPGFARLMRTLADALAPYPDAMAALLRTLDPGAVERPLPGALQPTSSQKGAVGAGRGQAKRIAAGTATKVTDT